MLPALEHVFLHDPRNSFLLQQRIENEFPFEWHLHPEMELTYIVRGRGTRFVGDHITRFTAGDLVLLGANLPHSWRADPLPGKQTHHSIYAQFHEQLLGAGWIALPEMTRIARLFRRSGRGLCVGGSTQKDVAHRMERMTESFGLARLLLLVETLDVIASAPTRHLQTLCSPRFSLPAPQSNQTKRIDDVCRHLNERFDEPISLAAAADIAGLSESAFSRFFSRMTGRTFKGYLNELRVGAACDLLIRTEGKIATIAGACGFENLSNFNRQFMKLKGISPVEFRAQFSE